jgi:hypothetical protein
MTHRITTLSIKKLSLMTISITTPNIMALSIMTLSIATHSITFKMRHSKQRHMMLNVIYTERFNFLLSFAACRGPKFCLKKSKMLLLGF